MYNVDKIETDKNEEYDEDDILFQVTICGVPSKMGGILYLS